ncbi:MAG: xanthine dehydrogenase family protein molybdopterin-binding subunit [Planctomycetes bacterium]|nr:xanthine dehydrogenase family protein molybdopterin-binding subunit [Planctomycetota bacterium]
MTSPTFSRRELLRLGAAAGGGLLVALQLPVSARALMGAPVDAFVPNAFVRVARDGAVTVIVNKAEMGQGVLTSLCMQLAEELDADWSRVHGEFAPVDPVYAHPGYGIQMTGGSTSTLGMGEPMRRAGAAARAVLVDAAAMRWGVPASECSTAVGRVLHAASGRALDYGELVDDAATLPVPADVPLKDPARFTLVGKPTHRLDTPDKVAGRAVFGLDVDLPGMRVALVAHPPTFGGRAKSFDAGAALAIPGVERVFDVGSGVAVVADGFWAAKRGRDALVIEWDEGPNASLSSDELAARYLELARTPSDLVARRDGDAEAALASAHDTYTVEYELPYLAHAPMEPLNCVVDLRADAMELWIGTQFQTLDHAAAAATAGLPPDEVRLHSTFLGGGFGRRANPVSDYVVEAVKVAKGTGAPIKLMWTREDDTRGGYYRPMWTSRLRAGLDADGALVAWAHTIVGQSFIKGTPFEGFIIHDGIDGTSVEGAEDLPYAIPNVRVDLHTTDVAVPTLWWRSVGHSHTAFVVESFLDELAHASHRDPLALRRELLVGHDRHLGVLERAAQEAGWGTPPQPGHARGLAVHFSFESYVAMVFEVAAVDGRVRPVKVDVAVDCGRMVNPDTIRAQLEGAVGFGLTATLYSAITLKDGRVEQGNFHDYKLLRVHEMPEVRVHLVASDAPSTGIGEPGVPPVAPAFCNALFALTGRRVRRLPLRDEDLRA